MLMVWSVPVQGGGFTAIFCSSGTDCKMPILRHAGRGAGVGVRSWGRGRPRIYLAVNPGPGQLVAMGMAGRRCQPGRQVAPPGQFRGAPSLSAGSGTWECFPGSLGHKNSWLADRRDHKSPPDV